MLGKKVKLAFFFLGIVSIFLFGITWWFTKTFGEIHILQVLWHIKNAHTLTGFDEDVVRHFLQFIGLCSIGSIMWFFILYRRQYIYIYITYKIHISLLKFILSKKIDILLYVVAAVSFCYISNIVYYKFSLYDLIKIKSEVYSEENDFFLHNYRIPAIEEVKFEKKNNLIIILLESMTTKLHVADETISYIPKLESLFTIYQHHNLLYNCTNTAWTIGALTAWTFGVPLNMPYGVNANKYTINEFLPKALCIFDIIAKNGYSSYLIMGSQARFAGTDNLFKRGNFTVYDSVYYQGQNKVNENNRSGWGIFDFFLYEEAYKKYLELREREEPFVLFMQTIDTHAPGYCPKDKVHYGDIRDSWLQTDDMLYNFIKKMEPFLETDNVSILIFGDHFPHGEFAKINSKNSLFNLFLGKSLPKIPESKLGQKINPMDIAPTILQAAGAKWDNNQFGLGISIFSEDKSFSETYGMRGLNEKLLYYSKFYDSFF